MGEFEKGKVVGDWVIQGNLGKGLCGVVVSAYRVDDEKRKQVAMKIVDLDKLNATFRDYGAKPKDLLDNLHQEIKILSLLKHRNIVSLETSFPLENKIFICMELVLGKDLVSLIPSTGLHEGPAKQIFFQICTAVAYCHSCQIIHGDLKPENILIRTEDQRAKLIDFGFAHIVTGQPLTVMGGTLLYSPPCDDSMTFAFDDWAMGVILYAMVTCSLPFTKGDLTSHNDLNLRIPPHIPLDVVSILTALLNPEPLARASSGDILLTSAWLSSEREKGIPPALSEALSQPKEPPQRVPVKARRTASVSRKSSNEPLVRTTRKLGWNPFDFFRKKKEKRDEEGEEGEREREPRPRKRSWTGADDKDRLLAFRSPINRSSSPSTKTTRSPKQTTKGAKSLRPTFKYDGSITVTESDKEKKRRGEQKGILAPMSPPFKLGFTKKDTRTLSPEISSKSFDFKNKSHTHIPPNRRKWFASPNYSDDADDDEDDDEDGSGNESGGATSLLSSEDFSLGMSSGGSSSPSPFKEKGGGSCLKFLALNFVKYCEDLSALLLRDRLPQAERKKIVPKFIDNILSMHNEFTEFLIMSADSPSLISQFLQLLGSEGLRVSYLKYYRIYPSCAQRAANLRVKYPKCKLSMPQYASLMRLMVSPITHLSECLGYLSLLLGEDEKLTEPIKSMMSDLSLFIDDCHKSLL